MIQEKDDFNSSSTTLDPTQSMLLHFSTIQNIQFVCYAIIFFIGVIGNVLVCLVVIRERRMRTVTNYFIVNLSVADLLVLCICIPFDFGEKMTTVWPYGEFLCRVIYPLQTLMTTASVGTLTAISLNRYHAVVYPLNPQLTLTRAKWIILLIWLLSLVLVSPYMAALQIYNEYCEEDWGLMSSKAYTLAIFLAQYVLPLSVIGLAYIRIGKDLKRKSKSCSYNNALQQEQERDSRRVVKMLLIVVITFAVLMFPLHVLFIWKEFGKGDEFDYFWEVVAFCQILIYTNSATNPIIYNACNEKFRDGFKVYFDSVISLVTSLTSQISVCKRGKSNNTLNSVENNGIHKDQKGELTKNNGIHAITERNNHDTSTAMAVAKDIDAHHGDTEGTEFSQITTV